jgi:hypothetical protein
MERLQVKSAAFSPASFLARRQPRRPQLIGNGAGGGPAASQFVSSEASLSG